MQVEQKPALGVTALSHSECSGHRQVYCGRKLSLGGSSPRIPRGSPQEASPGAGAGGFPFECALLSPPGRFFGEGRWADDDLRLLAAFIDDLRKSGQGNISAEVLQTTPEKVFREDIAGARVRAATCPVPAASSALVYFSSVPWANWRRRRHGWVWVAQWVPRSSHGWGAS